MDQTAEKIIIDVASQTLSSFFSEATKKVVQMIHKPKRNVTAVEPARDRRTHERRKGPIEFRLRKGIWYEFHRKTGLGETQLIDYFGSSLRDKLIEAAVIESDRFELRDLTTGSRMNAGTAVSMIVELAIQDWQRLPAELQHPCALTEAVARRLMANFSVKRFDRRDAAQTALAG